MGQRERTEAVEGKNGKFLFLCMVCGGNPQSKCSGLKGNVVVCVCIHTAVVMVMGLPSMLCETPW